MAVPPRFAASKQAGGRCRFGQMCATVEEDDSDPVFRDGDFAVIDTTVTDPEDGVLFLIEWNAGEREIIETYLRVGRVGKNDPAMGGWQPMAGVAIVMN